MEYADEPRLVFSSLSEDDYCEFYTLEMAHFKGDAKFYLSCLAPGEHVLELGCGPGRLTRILSTSCGTVTGVDISAAMLKKAAAHPRTNISYLQADMLDLSLRSTFDTVVIPYNTLNLQSMKEKVERCLSGCRKHLNPGGKLLLQLFHANKTIKSADTDNRIFQFAILDDTNGGKVVKETIKSYDRSSKTLHLEERYRVRPAPDCGEQRDLRHFLRLYCPDWQDWKKILRANGFGVSKSFGSAAGAPFSEEIDTELFIVATAD